MTRNRKKQSSQNENPPPLSPLPVDSSNAIGAWRYAVPVLLIVYLVLAILHMQSVPTGQTGYQNAPDEAAHLVYVRTLAAGHLPNRQESQNNPIAYEWHQPPLYYAFAVPLSGLDDRAVRSLSILFGLIAVILVGYSARLLFPEEPIVWALAASVPALLPTHIAITSTVNNDVLLEVCFSGCLLTLISSLRSGFTRTRAIWLGVWIGCALLTKSNGLLLFPIVLVASLLLIKNGEKGKVVWSNIGLSIITAAVISGWWFVHNYSLYGELLPLKAFEQAFAGTIQAKDVASGKIPGLGVTNWNEYFSLTAKWTFQSFWAVYGTARSAAIGAPRFLPEQYYQLMGLLTLCLFGGLLRAHFQKKKDFTLLQECAIQLSWAAAILVGLSFAGFILKYFQTQGRYLYPAMLPISVLFAVGWRSLIPVKYISAASLGLISLMAVLALLFIRYTMPA